MRWLCEQHWKVGPGMIVVNVGCSTARRREHFSKEIDYYGFDPNER
jgi:hypothetical protein